MKSDYRQSPFPVDNIIVAMHFPEQQSERLLILGHELSELCAEVSEELLCNRDRRLHWQARSHKWRESWLQPPEKNSEYSSSDG
ncbi:MAG: hypothetical protein KDK30_10130 [Leptospiraceae bacterium]|nr:hypothetical protein [Leptospiraceae bacterium]MCB1316329.1 hypothetical protein [Leptospiraceae bacterium]MCB1318750.1 hypothetical protein [Leptospiraceae bacterium]